MWIDDNNLLFAKVQDNNDNILLSGQFAHVNLFLELLLNDGSSVPLTYNYLI